MAYTTFPSTTSAGAPGATDDNTKGYVVGSQWINTSTSPRTVYICTNASTGAAVWAQAGGVTAHSSLTTLGWSASGHTGTTNSVACFSNTGVALTAQATVDGTVLTFSGGTLQFMAMAAAVAFTDPRAVDIEYLTGNPNPYVDAQVITGSFI